VPEAHNVGVAICALPCFVNHRHLVGGALCFLIPSGVSRKTFSVCRCLVPGCSTYVTASGIEDFLDHLEASHLDTVSLSPEPCATQADQNGGSIGTLGQHLPMPLVDLIRLCPGLFLASAALREIREFREIRELAEPDSEPTSPGTKCLPVALETWRRMRVGRCQPSGQHGCRGSTAPGASHVAKQGASALLAAHFSELGFRTTIPASSLARPLPHGSWPLMASTRSRSGGFCSHPASHAPSPHTPMPSLPHPTPPFLEPAHSRLERQLSDSAPAWRVMDNLSQACVATP
jgi:hypothetical protein